MKTAEIDRLIVRTPCVRIKRPMARYVDPPQAALVAPLAGRLAAGLGDDDDQERLQPAEQRPWAGPCG
jgi:hypothetical protein